MQLLLDYFVLQSVPSFSTRYFVISDKYTVLQVKHFLCFFRVDNCRQIAVDAKGPNFGSPRDVSARSASVLF